MALEKLQRATDKWDEDRTKRLGFINKRLRQKNEAKAYINNVDEAMVESCQVFAKRIKSLPPKPQLSDFCHPSIGDKKGELLIVMVVTGLATNAICKYFK